MASCSFPSEQFHQDHSIQDNIFRHDNEKTLSLLPEEQINIWTTDDILRGFFEVHLYKFGIQFHICIKNFLGDI